MEWDFTANAEVDEDTFYRVRESGGTRISSAYKKTHAIIERDFPVNEWNIYVFQHCFESRERYATRVALGALKVVLTPVLLLAVAITNLVGLTLEWWHHIPYFTANWTVLAEKTAVGNRGAA